MSGDRKPIKWVGTSRKDLIDFPRDVRMAMGHALFLAELGEKHLSAKPLHGFGGASVLEIVEDYDGGTYRAVYTVRFEDAIYVVHCFQKKSKHGAATPKQEIKMIANRLKAAQEAHEKWQNERKK